MDNEKEAEEEEWGVRDIVRFAGRLPAHIIAIRLHDSTVKGLLTISPFTSPFPAILAPFSWIFVPSNT